MKILTNLILLTTITLALLSCKKNYQEKEIEKDSSFQEIQKVSNDYLSSITLPKTRNAYTVAINADCGAYQTSFDNGEGHMAALESAIAKSSDVYHQLNGGVNPNPGGNVGYPNNKFDFVGAYHVEILDYIISNKTYFFDNDGLNLERFLSYTKKFFKSKNLNPNTGNTAKSLQLFLNKMDKILNNINGSLSNLVKKNDKANNILRTYYKALEQSKSVEGFVSYSIEVESIIIRSNFTQQDKEMLLSNMATVRHHVNYWGLK